MWIHEIHYLDVHPTREKGLSWCLHGCRGSTNAATSSEPGAAHGDSHASGRRVRIPYSKYMQIYQYAVCMYIYIYDIWYQHVRNKCFKWVTSPKWHVSVLVSLGWWATIVLSFGRFLHDDWDQNNGSCMTTLKLGVEWITTATQKKWPLKLDFGFYPLQNVKKPSRCSMVSAPSFRGVYGPGAWKT